ncbi:MAG: zinc-dependent peptidase [Chitinophagaceae bacterium]|nr:zinc-dependent peptidase [Chitinophagaceae bacterium]
MELVLILLVVTAGFVLLVLNFKFRKKTPVKTIRLPVHFKTLLATHVEFYNRLNEIDKPFFEERVQRFLSAIRITGIKTQVDDLDRVLIASSAIIPIFRFPDWEYINLNEVLLYPDSFSESFEFEGSGRNMLGLVGTGPYQNIMILSRQELRNGFADNSSKKNTAIHEFVHLIDKTDGEVDGVPEFLLSKKYIIPWLELVQRKIQQISENQSDINSYGATNKAEFFAVVSEYFFERPDLLQQNHPELYQMLSTIFKQHPQNQAV